MITLLLHISNSDPIKLDVEEMPKPTDTMIIGKNPRERTEKEVAWIQEGVTTVIFPIWRIVSIELLPSAADEVEFPLPFRTE